MNSHSHGYYGLNHKNIKNIYKFLILQKLIFTNQKIKTIIKNKLFYSFFILK